MSRNGMEVRAKWLDRNTVQWEIGAGCNLDAGLSRLTGISAGDCGEVKGHISQSVMDNFTELAEFLLGVTPAESMFRRIRISGPGPRPK